MSTMTNNKLKGGIRDTIAKQACSEATRADNCYCTEGESLCHPCAEITFGLMLGKARSRNKAAINRNLLGIDMAAYSEIRNNKARGKLPVNRDSLDEKIDDQMQRITYRDPADRAGRLGRTSRRGIWATKLARRASRALDCLWEVKEYYEGNDD